MFKKCLVSVWDHGRQACREISHFKTLQQSNCLLLKAHGENRGSLVRKLLQIFSRHNYQISRTPQRFQVPLRSLVSKLREDAARQLVSGSIFSRGFRRVSIYHKVALMSFVGFGFIGSESLDQDITFDNGAMIKELQALTDKRREGDETDISTVIVEDHDFDDYQFGEMIAKGCEAAVYEAKFKQETEKTRTDLCCSIENQEELNLSLRLDYLEKVDEDKQYDLAIKVMFNYLYNSIDDTIRAGMQKELQPIRLKEKRTFKKGSENSTIMKQHPNIIDILGSIVHEMEDLPCCRDEYPASLPTRLHWDGGGHNRTMYIIMPKHHCTLDDITRQYRLPFETSMCLFTQLLEGVLHMNSAGVAHRDLKGNNILLENFANGQRRLIICDFGCSVDSLIIPYNTSEVNKGGNPALMAPEIANAKPGSDSVLDYRKSDLWAAGALAYEIFGARNPFYGRRLDKQNYEGSLPVLECVPRAVQNFVTKLLRKNPNERPDPLTAANVAQLLLWAPVRWLESIVDRSRLDSINALLHILAVYEVLGDRNDLLFNMRQRFIGRINVQDLNKAIDVICELRDT